MYFFNFLKTDFLKGKMGDEYSDETFDDKCIKLMKSKTDSNRAYLNSSIAR